jgi:hypothetical protein
MKSLVYGLVGLNNLNINVAAAPPVKLYHPVVDALVDGAPEPPILVNPV